MYSISQYSQSIKTLGADFLSWSKSVFSWGDKEEIEKIKEVMQTKTSRKNFISPPPHLFKYLFIHDFFRKIKIIRE
jgi:hypothetical protein